MSEAAGAAEEIRDRCATTVQELVGGDECNPVLALYAIDRLCKFYEFLLLQFSPDRRMKLFHPVFERILQTDRYCSLKEYSGVEHYDNSTYHRVKSLLLERASPVGNPGIMKEEQELAQAAMCTKFVEFVCFMEVKKNKEKVGVREILRAISWSKGPSCLFTALSRLWVSEIGKHICFSAGEYRDTVRKMHSAASTQSAGARLPEPVVNVLLKHGIRLKQSSVQDFCLQELLRLCIEQGYTSDDDQKELLAYVTVYLENVEMRKLSLKDGLCSLFEGKSFTSVITVVDQLMKKVGTMITITAEGDKLKSVLKEAIEHAVQINVEGQQLIVEDLRHSLKTASAHGKFVCYSAFKAVLYRKSSLQFPSETSRWSKATGYVKKAWTGKTEVLRALISVVCSVWENVSENEVKKLALKVLELYQTIHRRKTLSNYNEETFALILSTPLARVGGPFESCSVSFEPVAPKELASQVTKTLKAMKDVQPSLDSCSLLLFHIWKIYCLQATGGCITQSQDLDIIAVQNICGAVTDPQESCLYSAMAAALIGNLFNVLLKKCKFFWHVPGAALLVATLTPLSDRLRRMRDCQNYFKGYQETKEEVGNWIRKAKSRSISVQEKRRYDDNIDAINSIVKAFCLQDDAAEYAENMNSLDFEKILRNLGTNCELLSWLGSRSSPKFRQEFDRLRHRITTALKTRSDDDTMDFLMNLREHFDSLVGHLGEKKLSEFESEECTLEAFAAYFLTEKSKLFFEYAHHLQGRTLLTSRQDLVEFLQTIHKHFVQLLQATESTKVLAAVVEEINKRNSTFVVKEELDVLKKFPPYKSLAEEGLLVTIESALGNVYYIEMLPGVLKTLDDYSAIAPGDILYGDLQRLENQREEIRMKPLSGIVSADVATVKEVLGVVPTQYWRVIREAKGFSHLQNFLRKFPNDSDFEERLNYVTTRLRSDNPDHALLNSVILAHDYLFPLMKKRDLREILKKATSCKMSFETAMEHLETVNSSIEQVNLLFEQATTESARQRAKDLSVLEIRLQRLTGESTTFFLVGEKKLSLKDQVEENQTVTPQEIKCSEQEILDLRRWLVFDTTEQDQDEDYDVKRFQSTLDMVNKLLDEIKTVEAAAHPLYQDKKVQISLNADALETARKECRDHLKSWQNAIRILREKNRLFHLLSETQIMAMLTIFTKSMSCRPTLLKLLMVKRQIPDTEDDGECPISARLLASYIHCTGYTLNDKGLEYIARNMATTFELNTIVKMGECISAVALGQPLLEIGDSGADREQFYCNMPGKSSNNSEVIGFLLEVFLCDKAIGFPCNRQVCWCEQNTTEQQVQDCLERVRAFPDRTFVFVGVDKLKPKARKLVNDIQKEQLDRSANVYYVYFDASDVPHCRKREDNKDTWQSLRTSWNKLARKTSGPKVEVVCGLPLTGKTTFILKERVHIEPTLIYIADSVDVEKIIQQLNSSFPLTDVVLMISSFAPLDEVNKLLFNLLVFRCLCSEQGVTCFAWSSDYDGKLVIELPCLQSKGSDKPWDGMTDTLTKELAVAAVAANDFFIVVDTATIPYTEVPGEATSYFFTAQIRVNQFSHGNVTVTESWIGKVRRFLLEDAKDRRIDPQIRVNYFSHESVTNSWVRNVRHLLLTDPPVGDDTEASILVNGLVDENAINVSKSTRAAASRNRYVRQYTSKFCWIQDAMNDFLFQLDVFDHVFSEADYLCKPKLDCSQLREFFSFLVPCKKQNLVYLIGNARSLGRQLKKIAAGGTLVLKDENNPETAIIAAMFGLKVQVVSDLLRRKDFVLTEDVAYKMVLLHHRRLSGIPVIIEGETGVGKTFLLDMYAQLLNARHAPDLISEVSDWIKDEVMNFVEGGDEAIVGNSNTRKVIKEKLDRRDYDRNGLTSLFKVVLEALPKENVTLQSKIANLLKEQIGKWHMSIRLLKGKGDRVTALPNERNRLSIDQTVQLLEEFLQTPLQSLFEKLLLHPGVSQQDIRGFISQVECAARSKKLKDLTLVVFFDEINTTRCLGTLKEIVCDHTLDGGKLPDNIFFTAAMNPFTGMMAEDDADSDFLDISRGTRSIPVHRHVYHVFQLPESMENYVWIYRGMKSDAMERFLRAKTTVTVKCIASSSDGMEALTHQSDRTDQTLIEDELLSCGRLMHAAHTFCQIRLGEGSVSQRDVKRVFDLVRFFWKYLPIFWIPEETNDPRHLTQVAIQLSVGIVYYLRLSQEIDEDTAGISRSAFAVEINKIVRTKYGIEEVMKTAIERFVTLPGRFRIPKGIALTKALSENIFTIVACIVSNVPVPLGIIGIPGSSKTLSVHIVRDNLRGRIQSHTDFCKELPAVDIFSHQCSEYSTSEEIQKTFETAIMRQKFYGASKRCVVFLDEAGLPREKLMVLKVLHPLLDNPMVSFVAISNFPFDTANTNRMVILRRSLDQEDLEVLAKGCLGIETCDEKSKICHFGKGLCQGFRCVLKDELFRQMFHYRDFIYTLLYIRSNDQSAADTVGRSFPVPSPIVVLHALEENMNGIGRQEFCRLVEVFFEGLQGVFGRDYGIPQRCYLRRETEIMRCMLSPQTVNKEFTAGGGFGSRFVMVIDPAKDETAIIRMLFDSGLLRHDEEKHRIKLLTLSDFEGDDSSLKVAETLARIRYALKDPCTLVLQNTSRINSPLYDLFNQTFNIMAAAEDGKPKRLFANIAVGEFTYPCEVDPGFKCVVIIREADLLSTAPPFLSRFSKFRLSATHFFSLHLEETRDPDRKDQIAYLQKKVKEFLNQIGPDILFGIIDTETAISQLFLAYMCEEVTRTKQKTLGQAVLDERVKAALSKWNPSQSIDCSLVTLCSRLLQLSPPEVVILSLEKIDKSWRNLFARVYFELQEHFNLEKLIAALGTADESSAEVGASVGGNKLLLYCRCKEAVQDLCDGYEKNHKNDWMVFNGTNIQSSSEVCDFLLRFTGASQLSVALLVLPPTLSAHFRHLRLMLQLVDDAYQYSTTGQTRGILDTSSIEYQPDVMKRKTFIVMLPHQPDSETAETVHPAQFLDGWNTFFIDLSVADRAVQCLKVFVRLQYLEFTGTHGEISVDRDTKKLLCEWLAEEGAKLFCEGHHNPRVHEEILKLFNRSTDAIYSTKADFQERNAAVQQILSDLTEVATRKFLSRAPVASSISGILRRLAFEVFAKKRSENISTLADIHLRPFLGYFSHFLAQVSANFGLSTIFGWMSNRDEEEGKSLKALLNILPLPREESKVPIILLCHLPFSVWCDTYTPYRTPLFDLLTSLLMSLTSQGGISEDNEVDLIAYLQSNIERIPGAVEMASVIDQSPDRLSGWIRDLIQKAVSTNTTLVATDELLSPAEAFVQFKLKETANASSQFVAAFVAVHGNKQNVAGIVRGCRALDHLGMLSSLDLNKDPPYNFEEMFWIDTINLLNEKCIDQAKWMSSVSLVIPLFTSLSSLKPKSLKSGMTLMLLLYGLTRTSADLTEIVRIKCDFRNESTGESSSYNLSNILNRLSALAKTSQWLADNVKSVLKEVLLLYVQHPSCTKSSKGDFAVLRRVLESGFPVGHKSKDVPVVLSDSTVLSLVKIQTLDDRTSGVDTIRKSAKLSLLIDADSGYSVERVLAPLSQEDQISYPVLFVVQKLLPALKHLKEAFLSIAILHEWMYKELPWYAECVDETLGDATEHFQDFAIPEDRERIPDPMKAIQLAVDITSTSVPPSVQTEETPQLCSLSLKQCLRTSDGEGNGFLYELLKSLARIQLEVIEVLRRHPESGQAGTDWTVFGRTALYHTVSLAQILDTGGLSLIYIDESRLLALTRFCWEDNGIIELSRLERLVIDTFLRNACKIDLDSLLPVAAFSPMGKYAKQIRSVREEKDDVPTFIDLWLNICEKPPESATGMEDTQLAEMKESVDECCVNCDQVDAEYCRRVQPYKGARALLQKCADLIDQYPDQLMSTTLKKHKKLDYKSGGMLLDSLPEIGRRREKVLSLILRYESDIRAQEYQKSAAKMQLWSPAQAEETEKKPNKVQEGNGAADIFLKPLQHWYPKVDDRPVSHAALADGDDDSNDSDYSDEPHEIESAPSKSSCQSQNDGGLSEDSCEDEEEPIDVEQINLVQLVREHALKLWKTDECKAQAAAQYSVVVETPQQPNIVMHDLRIGQEPNEFKVYSGLREDKFLISPRFCTRGAVEGIIDRSVSFSSARAGSSQQYFLSNHVGLVLSKEERPLDESLCCSQLFLIRKTATVIIQLQQWKEDCDPLHNSTFCTVKRDFAVESTIADLLATAVWYAVDCNRNQISSDSAGGVIHYDNGIVIPKHDTTVADLCSDQTLSLFCTFGCRYVLRCVDIQGKQFCILPGCFKQFVVSFEAIQQNHDKSREEFLVWNDKTGDKEIDGIVGEETTSYVIPWRAVFYVSVVIKGDAKAEHIPVLYTNTPKSVGNYVQSLFSQETFETHSLQILKRRVPKSEKGHGNLPLRTLPIGWSCSNGTKLEWETQSLGIRNLSVERRLDTGEVDNFVVEVDWGEHPSVSNLLYLVSTKPPWDQSDKEVEYELYCLVDVASRVVLEESEHREVLVNSSALELKKVELALINSVVHCNLPVFSYDFKSGKRKRHGDEKFRFSELPAGTVPWEQVRHFLALKKSTQRKGKGPHHCALPPFLTFNDCNIVVNSYSNFFKLLSIGKEIGLSIGFWEVLKPEQLIEMEIALPASENLHCELTIDSARKITIRDLLRLLSKIEGQTAYQCCLITDGRNPLSKSLTLVEVLREEVESINLQFASSDTVNVKIRFQSEPVPVEMKTLYSFEDAIVASVKAFNIEAAPDLFTLWAGNRELVEPSNTKIPFFKTLEDNDLDPEENEFALIPVVDTVWVGKQGFTQLRKLPHPYYSEVSVLRNEAARVLDFDPEEYQLVLGDDILVHTSSFRFEKVVDTCKTRQFLHEGKPVIRFAEYSDSARPSKDAVATQPELFEECNKLDKLVPRCAPYLWHSDEYGPLSEDRVEYPVTVQVHRPCIPMEDINVDDNEKKRFTVDVVGDHQGQISCGRRFRCFRLLLESEVKQDRRRSNEEFEEFCLANHHGLVLHSHETPKSHKFTLVPEQLKCAVRVHFRNAVVSESEAADWDYSSLFRGDGGAADKSKSVWVLEREVCQTVTVQKLAEMAIWFWYKHTNVKADDIVIHCDDGSVPKPTEMMNNLSEEQRLNLWCNVGCKNSIVLADQSAVIPDHFPLKRLRDFQHRSLDVQKNFQAILREYFVWPSYRVLTSASAPSSSSVFVLPRSPRAVFVVTVTKETREQVALPVMPTTTCQSLLDYLSRDDGMPMGRLECTAESDAEQRRLLPPSLPVGHVVGTVRPVMLYHVTSPMTVKVYDHKRARSFTVENMTVEKLHREVCTKDKLVKTDFCLVDSVTRCRLPHTVAKETPLTMTSLNVPRIEVVHKQDLVNISMQAVCYSKSGPVSVEKSKFPHDVTFWIQKPSSEPKQVSWQLLASFLGSTMSFAGLGPFNSAIRAFLIVMNTDNEGSIVMLNPNLDIGKLFHIAKSSHYQLAVGYWKSYEEGPLMNITVQRYNPRVSMKFQAEHETNITIRDVAEAVSLQVAENQSRCIIRQGGTACTRDTRLSDLAQCDSPNVCLTLHILDEMVVDVHFEPERLDIRVTVKISDRSEQLIERSLAEFHIDAKPQLFQLYRDEETSVPLSQGRSLEDLLESSGRDPLNQLHFLLSPVTETFDVTVNINGQTQMISVRHPPFSTLEKFVDSIATQLSEELERDVRNEINLYATCGKDKEKVQIDDERLDELIEDMKEGARDRNSAIVTFTVELF